MPMPSAIENVADLLARVRTLENRLRDKETVIALLQNQHEMDEAEIELLKGQRDRLLGVVNELSQQTHLATVTASEIRHEMDDLDAQRE